MNKGSNKLNADNNEKIIIEPNNNIDWNINKYTGLFCWFIFGLPFIILFVYGIAYYFENPNDKPNSTDLVFIAAFLASGILINWLSIKIHLQAKEEENLARNSIVSGIEINKKSIRINIKYVGGLAVKWLRQNKAPYLDLEWNKVEEILLQPSFYSSAKLDAGDPSALRIKLRLTVDTQDPFLQFMSKYMDDYADVWIIKRYLSGKENDVLLFIEKNALAKVKILKTEE